MNADDLRITLAEGTENAAHYAYADVAAEEPNAALFSKADLTIGGSGSLTVNANFNHGISSKDDLVIESGSFTIRAPGHGIRGKDSLTVLDGSFVIEAGGDGLQASNAERADRGWILLEGGQYTLSTAGDGIQAETGLTISGGTYHITTGGTPRGDSTSQKGLKAETLLTINGGDFHIDSLDDALHSNANIHIDGGTFHLQTGDDGIHADGRIDITGGIIDIPVCYEGIEASHLVIAGGDITIISSDDGISIAGGGTNRLEMSGGMVSIDANDDGIDINDYGNMLMSGGTLVSTTSMTWAFTGPTGILGLLEMTGGTYFGAGNSSTAQLPAGDSTQPSFGVFFAQRQPTGTLITLSAQDGTELFAFTATHDVHSVVYGGPELVMGGTYVVQTDTGKAIEVTLGSLAAIASEDGLHHAFARHADIGMWEH